MAKFVYFFIVALAFQAVLARPKKATQEKSSLDQIVENIDNIRREVEATIQKVMPNNKEVNKALVDISKTFAATVEQGTRNLAEHIEINKPLVEKMVNEASGNIAESITYIRGLVGEDVAKKSDDVRKNVETNINTIFTEGKKVEEALKPTMEHAQESAKKIAGDFFEMLKSAGERFKTDLDRALAEKAQKH